MMLHCPWSWPLWEQALSGQANPAKKFLTPLQSFLVYKKDYFVMQPGTSVKDFLLISCPQIQNRDQCIICSHDWEQMELNNCKKLIHCQWNVSLFTKVSQDLYYLVSTASFVAFITGMNFPTNAALCRYCKSEKHIFWGMPRKPNTGNKKSRK